MQQPKELGMFPRKQCETTPRPSSLSLLRCAATHKAEGRICTPPVLGKRKGFSQGIEGMSDLTARPQHLTHSGLSPWIKAAKHGGRHLERGAIPALGRSIKEESERKEPQKHQII